MPEQQNMPKKAETLVVLSPGFPENEQDTNCLPALQIFVKTIKQHYPKLNIVVIAFQYPFIPINYDWFGIKVFAIGGKNKSRIFRLVTWVKALLILKKLNSEFKLIGLLSFWFSECAFVGIFFSRIFKIKHFTWLLGQDAKTGNRYFKWINPRADTLIALSDFLADQVNANYGLMPFKVVQAGIDVSLFDELADERAIDILGAGSLIRLKQYHVFIDVVKFITQSMPNIKVALCGAGPEMESLKAKVASLNLRNNITFYGEIPHKNVLKLMQRSKVFLHTSNYEGFGVVIAEALYAGSHVVSFNKPMNSLADHHFVAKNMDEMQHEVLRLLKNPGLSHQPVLMGTVQEAAAEIVKLYYV